MRAKTWLWGAVVVILVAAALRLPAFGSLPPGLYHDEAIHGLDALDVLQGRFRLYFPANNGREPLFIYLVALSIAMFGRSPFALRLPSLVAGVLTVAATAAMGRALFSRRVGLLGSAVLSVMLWHVHLSRTGYRAILLPLFAALAIWQGALAIRTRRRRCWIAAGAFFGLSAYSYTAARLVPFALGAFAIYAWAAWPQVRDMLSSSGRVLWRGALAAALAGLAATAPLLVYALIQPEVVLGRPGQVSVFSPAIHGGAPWATLGSHVLRTLGMFFVRGDRIWRHNVPWRPVFDPVLGAAFIVGLALALRRMRRHPPSAFLLLWTGSLLLPTMLAEDAPHFLRAVGVLPVAAVFPALGLDWLGGVVQRALARRETARRRVSRYLPGAVLPAVLVLPLAYGLASTARDYFGSYATDPTTAYWFEKGAVDLAGSVNGFLGEGWDGTKLLHGDPAGRRAYVDPKLWADWPQVRFLVPRSESVTVGTAGELARSDVSAFAWPYDDWDWVWATLPSPREVTVELGSLSQGDRDAAPYRTYLAIYGAKPDAGLPAVAMLSAGVEYLGFEVRPTGEGAVVRLRWRATLPLDTDYTIFVHYLRDGDLLGQADAGGANGLYPTSRWQPGDIINDDHLIELEGEPIPGRDVLRFGFWQPDSGDVLHVLDETGNPAADWFEVPVGG